MPYASSCLRVTVKPLESYISLQYTMCICSRVNNDGCIGISLDAQKDVDLRFHPTAGHR